MLLTIVIARAALAQEQRPLADDDFVIATEGGRAEVTSLTVPKGIGIDPRYRICRVSVDWTGEAWAPRVQEGCHPNLVEAVEEAARAWEIDVEPPDLPVELFEYWVVFPEKRGGDVRLFVRQAWDAELRLIPEWIVPLGFGVKGRVFPEYPAAAVGADTSVTQCDVRVDISTTGMPHAVHVSRCDEVFHPAAEEAIRRWRFTTPELDGVPFWTGVDLGVRFVRDYDAEEGEPPGKALVELPSDPDLGSRSLVRLEEAPEEEREPPPEPTWDPLFVVDHKSYAEVGVYDIRWPEPLEGDQERTCQVLFQVNSKRQVWAWAEDCDEQVAARTEAAANAWSLKHGTIEKGEWYARFRATLVYPADSGHVQLLLPEGDLVSPPRALPEHVHSYAPAKPVRRAFPKLPKGFATEVLADSVSCEYEVHVDKLGRPAEIVPRDCPASYAPYAEKAIKRWRWAPAESEGKPVASTATVRLRFEQPELSGG